MNSVEVLPPADPGYWLDRSGLFSDGERVVLVAYLDLSRFPTVRELEARLAATPAHRSRFSRLTSWLSGRTRSHHN